MPLSLLLAIVFGFCVGVGWRTSHEVPQSVCVWVLLLALATAVVWRKNSKVAKRSSLLVSSVFLLALAVGVFRVDLAAQQFGTSALEDSVGSSVSLQGVVVREPDVREQTVHLYVEIGDDTVLVTADRLSDVSYGDEILVEGVVKKPTSFETDLGRTFDYAGYLRARGVEYQISYANIFVTESGLGNLVIEKLLTAKKKFTHELELVIPEPEVSLGEGLLLGIKSALGEDIEDDFRRTGIIHIVVLSGYNVMLVVAFILFCFSYVLPFKSRVIAAVLAIGSFAIIVGLSATVVRASVMAVFVLLAQVLGRRYNVIRALLFAGLIMLFFNPYLLMYDIGFQLSFMATLGLVLIVPQLESTMIEQKKLFAFREFFLATVATQIAVLPLLMYHIGQVSLIAVIVNMLVLPVVPIVMLLTFMTGIIHFVLPTVASVIGYISTLLLKYILLVAGWFEDVPFAAVTVPQFSAVGVFILYVCLGGSLFWWREVRQEKKEVFEGE